MHSSSILRIEPTGIIVSAFRPYGSSASSKNGNLLSNVFILFQDLVKADVDKPFKLNGLFLAPDASSYLLQIVGRVEPKKRQKVLRRLVETILKLKIEDTRITRALCENAVNECKAERSVDTPVLFVIDAFEVSGFVIFFNYLRLRFLGFSIRSH